MIEKRIGYQDGRGVHDPLETIVFLMSKRSSPGGLSSAEEQELQRLMDETGFMSQKKSQGGRIGYNGGGKPNGSKPPWGEVPFDLDKWLQEIDPGGWMDEDKPNGETRRINQDGIMRVASARGDREYLLMTLSRYYTPRDLYYKTTKELNKMLESHLTETGGLI